MKVFVTGASGFIGSAVIKELLANGHEVVGLARSEESAKAVAGAGAQVLRGSLHDVDVLKQAAAKADGIIHTAFIHDFTQYAKSAEIDQAAIEAMGEVLRGTTKPIIATGGVLGLSKTNGFATEANAAQNSPRASEAAIMALAEAGINASIIRLPPSVHGIIENNFRAGFVSSLIQFAKQNGVSAYTGDGSNCWSAVHRLDAASAFRLALEKSARGGRYNVIGDEGIKMREIATFIGEKLNVPVKSLTQEQAQQNFQWMSTFIGSDASATSYQTQGQLSWKPTHIGLREDLRENYV